MGEYGTYRPVKSTQYQSEKEMPLKLDYLLYFLLCSCIGAIILYSFLVITLPILRNEPGYSIIVELTYVIPVMALSDFIASRLADYLDKRIIKRWGYIRHPKTRKNRLFKYLEYFLYIVIRASIFVFGMFWFLFDYLQDTIIYPFNNIPGVFLLTIMIVSLLSRIASWGIANILFRL